MKLIIMYICSYITNGLLMQMNYVLVYSIWLIIHSHKNSNCCDKVSLPADDTGSSVMAHGCQTQHLTGTRLGHNSLRPAVYGSWIILYIKNHKSWRLTNTAGHV